MRPELDFMRSHGEASFPEDLIEMLLATPVSASADANGAFWVAPSAAPNPFGKSAVFEDSIHSTDKTAPGMPLANGLGCDPDGGATGTQQTDLRCQSAAARTGLILRDRSASIPAEPEDLSELFTAASSELKAIMVDMLS